MFPGCYALHGDDNSFVTQKVEAVLRHRRIPYRSVTRSLGNAGATGPALPREGSPGPAAGRARGRRPGRRGRERASGGRLAAPQLRIISMLCRFSYRCMALRRQI